MKFKTIQTQTKHIEALLNGASDTEKIDGGNWYKEANTYAHHLSELFNLDSPCKVAGIISALSPATNWERNKSDAHNFIALALNGDAMSGKYGTYKNNVRKALEIFNLGNPNKKSVGTILRGKTGYKTESFFYNIYDLDSSEVTIDRHAIKGANNVYEGGSVALTEKRYRDSERAYQKVAKKYNLKPYQVQAIVWVTYRRLRGLK